MLPILSLITVLSLLGKMLAAFVTGARAPAEVRSLSKRGGPRHCAVPAGTEAELNRDAFVAVRTVATMGSEKCRDSALDGHGAQYRRGQWCGRDAVGPAQAG